MLTQEMIPGEATIDAQGNMRVEYRVVIKRGEEIIHSFKEYVQIEDSDAEPTEAQSQAIELVESRLASVRAIVEKRKQPKPPKGGPNA